jgi:hypothetical protein
MQNRSIFPYRRHGPKKRVKHGGPNNRKPRGPHKGLPNSARDLLPMLQPATKALAQVLAGRAGASGQLGHARTMLAQAERMIAERAHNRLTPAEREEFFEQLARLKLTLADADAEAEVQAVEDHEPRPQAPPVARERLKEMALALSVREQLAPESAAAQEAAGAGESRDVAGQSAEPVEVPAQDEAVQAQDPAAEAPAIGPGATARGQGRLVLPKASADQVAQAVALGGIARRRSRASSRAAMAAAMAAAGESPAETEHAPADPEEPVTGSRSPETRGSEDGSETHAANADDDAAQPHGGNGASAGAEIKSHAKTTRRSRKPKHQGLPEGWVIDEEGFVVPGAG